MGYVKLSIVSLENFFFLIFYVLFSLHVTFFTQSLAVEVAPILNLGKKCPWIYQRPFDLLKACTSIPNKHCFIERGRALPLRVSPPEIRQGFERQRSSLLDHEDARRRRGPNVHRQVRFPLFKFALAGRRTRKLFSFNLYALSLTVTYQKLNQSLLSDECSFKKNFLTAA